MTHAAVSQRLSAYLDRELDRSERTAVDAPLATCAVCRRDLAELGRVKTLLGALPDLEPPAAVFAGARARLERPAGMVGPAAEWLRSAFRRPAVAAAAALLAVLLIAVPMAKGRIARLQAADVGVEVYIREHALLSVTDPFADPAYLGLLISDANVALVGQRRTPEEGR